MEDKNIFATLDTFSKFTWATAHMGERAKDLTAHLLSTFVTIGIPKQMKMDNGPVFASSRFKSFCQLWNITHHTGIPHNPQGQGIIERTQKPVTKTKGREIPS